MSDHLIQPLEPQYRELQQFIDLLAEGQCKITDVKQRSAPFGIYREKDTSYMCRIRRNAGRVSTTALFELAGIMKAVHADHAHLSTRQNIQLHGVPANKVYETIHSCNSAGMIFKGGGGNTFRSIITSPRSGVSTSEAFDVIPHVNAAWDWISCYERAFDFGRKFKVGFSAEPADDIQAGIQDLGFVAQLHGNERGFKVYCGGGLGRNAAGGILISEFIPETDVIRFLQAAVDLFYEHGNRKVRAKARLRFLLQDMGEKAFRDLFFQYLEKSDAPDYIHSPVDYDELSEQLNSGSSNASEGFESWATRSILNTSIGDEIKSVHLRIRDGNLTSSQLHMLAEATEQAGIQEIRLTATQDILIPMVHVSMLPSLYRALKSGLPDAVNLTEDLTGQITSCIGAKACSVGLLETDDASVEIAKALNNLMAEFPELPSGTTATLIQGIHLSGCASCCGRNQLSAMGYHGHKKRLDNEVVEFFQLHIGGQVNEQGHALAITHNDWLVKAHKIGPFTATLVRPYLAYIIQHGFQSLEKFMAEKRTLINQNNDLTLQQLIKIIEE